MRVKRITVLEQAKYAALAAQVDAAVAAREAGRGAGRRHQGVMDTALLITLAALCGADIGLSMAAVTSGGYVEVNPLLRPLQERPALYGAVKAGITAGAVVGVWKVTTHKPRARIVALLGIVAMQAIVVGVNYTRYH